MENALLTNLKKFYDEDPDDPFTIYALALEYLKHDPEKAGDLFDLLLNNHSDYLPVYYHAAAFFALHEKIEKAKEMYLKGIDLALKMNNIKTHQELKRAYQSLLDDLEE